MSNALIKQPDHGLFADVETRWMALTCCDSDADGRFVYAVKTTGVYCRPSCASRLPRRENVCFFDDWGEAEEAGFRACKRCCPSKVSPKDTRATTVEMACRLIEASEVLPDLGTLAATAGLSPTRFHRVFKGLTGVTPKEYGVAHRARRLREALAQGGTITAALYDAGFNSSGPFHAASLDLLGMTPSKYQAGGKGETIRFAVGESSMGAILVAATGTGICHIALGDDRDALLRDLQDRFHSAEFIGGDRDFERTVAQVVGFVEYPALGHSLPLDVRGTAFQQRVWQALRDIPAGATVTYTELAQRVDAPRSVRAVARACASNTLAIAVPCHRVIRANGDLAGYRWGVERKRELLRREREG